MNKYSDFSIRQNLLNTSKLAKSLSPEICESQNRLPQLKLVPRTHASASPEPSNSVYFLTPDYFPGHSPIYQSHFSSSKALDPESYKPCQKTLKLPNLDSKNYKKSDFSLILDQIESVVSPKVKFQTFLLREDDPITEAISPKHPVYFKIYTKSKKTPLSVTVKEYGAKVVIYLSFSDSQPKSSSYDRVYFKSYFEVSDQAFEFKSEVVYLGVYAEKDSRFKIQANFGKIKSLKQLRTARNEEALSDNYEEFYSHRSLKEKNSLKDFVKANKDVNYQLGVSKLRDFQLEHEKWQKKRAEIVKRKKSFEKAKKVKAIQSLNRQARRLELEEKLKNDLEVKTSLKKSQKHLIILIFLIKSLNVMNQMITIKRRNTFRRISTNIKATLLQKYIKKNLLKPNNQLSKHLASSSLLLFRNSCKPLLLQSSSQILIKFITQKAKANLLVHQVGNFGFKILKIQRNYRRHLILKRIKLKRLNDLWKKCIEKLVAGSSDSKSKKNRSMKYKAIPTTAKNRVLGDYYQSCWLVFKMQLRDFLQNKKKVVQGKDLLMPSFNYMPSEVKMKEMIQHMLKKKS
jgi:hypothetical protein